MAAENEGLFYKARTAIAHALEPQGERDKIVETVSGLLRAYEQGPWQLPPEALVQQLKEQDTWMIQDILNQMDWESLGTYASDTSAERERAINDSARLFKYSPLAQFSLWLWTGWGLGDEITVLIRDNDKVQEIWDEFWHADRNRPVIGEDIIHDLSNFLLRDGNTFLAFYASTPDGKCTVRELPTREITKIVTDPDDWSVPLFYMRTSPDAQKEMYYTDWLWYLDNKLDDDATTASGSSAAIGDNGSSSSNSKPAVDMGAVAKLPDNAIRMETQRGGTDVTVLHIAHNRKERDSLWGWPLLTCSRAFMSAHKGFTESRLTVAKAKSMFVRRKQVAGGSRAVNAVSAQLQSALSRTQSRDTNAPPYSGSVEVDNEAVRTVDLPMTTGASDAKADNELFAWTALLGAGLFPTSAGLDTTRWATALEMDKAQSMLFETYKTYWSAQFTKMVRVVIGMYEKYNPDDPVDPYTVQVSTDTLSLNDLPQIATSVGNLMSNALGPLIEPGIVPVEAAKKIVAAFWHIILQSAGVTNADAITSSESFEFGDYAVAAPPVVPRPAEEKSVDVGTIPSTYLGDNVHDIDTSGITAIVREMVADAISNGSGE